MFGGYDGQRNHSTLHVFDHTALRWVRQTVGGTVPLGRNGHTATLAEGKLFIIGGWLGSGPLAASDVHYIELSEMKWVEPPVLGEPPGPCNMHTSDYLPQLRRIFVFRGGDGREYLNDLHSLDVDTYRWEKLECAGTKPEARANHCSAVLGHRLFIFGGWNGNTRLNDVHVLDTDRMIWSRLEPRGVPPPPRAGMTLTRIRDRLYLFGGSGPAAKCFDDLQILDLKEMCWTEITSRSKGQNGNGGLSGSTGGGNGGGGGSAAGNGASSTASSLSNARAGRRGGSGGNQANPNDEHVTDSVSIWGEGPGPRAGHSATMLDRRLVIFGGSHGSKYLGDMFVLDTDPVPEPLVNAPSCNYLVASDLRQYIDREDFSDVTLYVEGRPIRAHRLVLSIASDRFRAMFSSGFVESSMRDINVEECSYTVFKLMMEYIYSGDTPSVLRPGSQTDPMLAAALLEVADQYMLDHLKELCELRLTEEVREDTVETILELSERTNSWQLRAVCRHFIRNRDEPRPAFSS